MKVIKSYTGKIGAVYMTVCDEIPEGMVVKEERTVIKPDDGKYFLHNGQLIDTEVILKSGEKPENYIEIDIPNYVREKEE